jgi:hypothetical protein
MMRARMIMIVASKKLIQIGDNTQIHGHAITLVSLRPTKRTVSSPGRPIPPEEEEEEDDMVLRAMGKGITLRERK